MATGRVRVYIDADATGVRRGTAAAQRDLSTFGRVGSRSLDLLKGAAVAAGAAIGTGLVIELGRSISAAREAEKVTSQTRAVIKSMGNSANVTAEQVGKLADAISLKAGIDDEAIQSAENLLLTFKNIRNESGKGNAVFTRTTRLVTDMSVALGQDMKQSAIQLGKALNDPSAGLSALRRVGVSFNATQTEMIQKLFESGEKMKAQKLILRELNREFKGSAAAQADPIDKAKVAWENLEESLGKALLPTVGKLAGSFAKFVNQIRTGKGEGGKFAKDVKKAFEDLKPTLKVLWDVFKAVFKAIFALFKTFIQFQMKLSKAWEWLVGKAKSIWGSIKSIWRDGRDAVVGFINDIIDAINIIPGVDIGHIGGGGSNTANTGGGTANPSKGRRQPNGQKLAVGGKVNRPMAIVGEEAPRHPEYVLATNPAYRRRNVGLWQQAGHELGIPGFALGGVMDKLQNIGGALPSLSDITGKLPSPSSLPGYLRGMGVWLLDKAKDWVKDKISDLFSSSGGGGVMRHYPMLSGDTDFSPALGLALSQMARATNTPISVTSGWRSRAEQTALWHAYLNGTGNLAARPGTSHHETGRAADISPGREVFGGIARRFGLGFTVPSESWHIEKLARGGRRAKVNSIKSHARSILHGSGTKSKDELTTLAKFVGMRNPALMAAIALAESGGNPHAMGGAGDKGLWQEIPSTAAYFGTNYGGLFDPLNAARGAKKVLDGQGLSAWTTYRTGAYRHFLGGKVKPALLAAMRGRVASLFDGPGKGAGAGGGRGGGGKGGGGGKVSPLAGTFGSGLGTPGHPGKVTWTKWNGKEVKGGGQDELVNSLRELSSLLKAQLAAANAALNMSQSQYGVLAKAIADVASGQIGGKVGLGFGAAGNPGLMASY